MNNYFPHDSNARNSDKLIPVRMRHGAVGYAVYFMILERLREEPSHASVKDYNSIAFDLRVDTALVKSIVEDFGLFAFADDGKCFYSESFSRRMNHMSDVSRKRGMSARSRWEKRSKMQLHDEPGAIAPGTGCKNEVLHDKNHAIKETKLEEKKIEENNTPPLPPSRGEERVTISSPGIESRNREQEKKSGKPGKSLQELAGTHGFEEIWDMYGKKGNKKSSARRWATLPVHHKQAALDHLPRYVQSTPEIRYRKNLETYLNQECWNDQIIENKKDEKTTNPRIHLPRGLDYGESTI